MSILVTRAQLVILRTRSRLSGVMPDSASRIVSFHDVDARPFRTKIKWRTGCEGRINHLKRSYGWNRTELTTLNGARTWCGHAVFAHNLVKISALNA